MNCRGGNKNAEEALDVIDFFIIGVVIGVLCFRCSVIVPGLFSLFHVLLPKIFCAVVPWEHITGMHHSCWEVLDLCVELQEFGIPPLKNVQGMIFVLKKMFDAEVVAEDSITRAKERLV